ncbi:MAG TPA: GNAT family N-acetyltransferase [Polyangiaceae bacterium]|jgi:putative acetyltransferase|nr:GNAT family N-acetyltransferase [Polyangiaceae bacterium]
MTVTLRPMIFDDYAPALALWKRTEGIGLNDSDSEQGIRTFLERNPGLSAVALNQAGALVGAVLCGHDSRRGYLHHLAVDRAHRNQGIARKLLAWCLERLAAERIHKCNIFLFASNTAGAAFWEHAGFVARDDLRILQKVIG